MTRFVSVQAPPVLSLSRRHKILYGKPKSDEPTAALGLDLAAFIGQQESLQSFGCLPTTKILDGKPKSGEPTTALGLDLAAFIGQQESLQSFCCFCDTHLLRSVIKLFKLGRLDLILDSGLELGQVPPAPLSPWLSRRPVE